MRVVIRKRAINALVKAAEFVEAVNTPGSGEKWLGKVKEEILSLAASKGKFAICRHPSLAKHSFRCYVYNDWIIAFKVTENQFEVHRFIWGARMK